MDNAITLVEFKLESLKKNIDISNTDGKISYLNSVATILSKINNSMERELYVNKISTELQDKKLLNELGKIFVRG